MTFYPKRAIRRKHTARLKKKRANYHTNGRKDGRIVNTPCPCSCHMCCNERSSDWSKGKEKLTVQERRLESISDLVEEYL